jgi:hypothetical protein
MTAHLHVFVSACARTRVCVYHGGTVCLGAKMSLACARCVCVRVQALACICVCALLPIYVLCVPVHVNMRACLRLCLRMRDFVACSEGDCKCEHACVHVWCAGDYVRFLQPARMWIMCLCACEHQHVFPTVCVCVDVCHPL